MTDAEKLKAILDYAKRSYDFAIYAREFASTMFYEKKDETYTYEMVLDTQRDALTKGLFFHQIRQIIEEPDEYLKEQALLEEYVKRLDETRKKEK